MVGVDPGKTGGIATYFPPTSASTEEWGVIKMPVISVKAGVDERAVWNYFKSLTIAAKLHGAQAVAYIEEVSGHIGIPQPGGAMFGFGRSYEIVRMAVIATDYIRLEDARPQEWQKRLGIPPRKKEEGDTAWKNRLKAKAQNLFPQFTVTLATADALLIGEFGRRKENGQL